MNARTERVLDLAPSDLARWRALAERALEPNPFYEPHFVLPYSTNAATPTELYVVLVEEGDSMLACLPVHFDRPWHKLPFSTCFCFYRSVCNPLVDADRAADALDTLVDHLIARRREGGTRFFACDQLVEDGLVARHLGSAFGRKGLSMERYEHWERPMLYRNDTGSYLDERLGRKERSTLARKRRRLGEALGGEPVLVDRAGDEQAVESFLLLEASGWKGRDGTALACRPQGAEVFRELCRNFAALGRLQLLSFEVEGTAVAMECRLRGGPGVFVYKLGFSDAYAKFSPGTLLTIESIDHFHNQTDAAWVDCCNRPEFSEVLERFWGGRRRVATVSASLGGWFEGRVVRSLVPMRKTFMRLRGKQPERGVKVG